MQIACEAFPIIYAFVPSHANRPADLLHVCKLYNVVDKLLLKAMPTTRHCATRLEHVPGSRIFVLARGYL